MNASSAALLDDSAEAGQTSNHDELLPAVDTRDELGIGIVRDAFANYFFPGITTAQTRARYMLFVPWMYVNLEREGVRSAGIADQARSFEVRLIRALADSGDTRGLIGRVAEGDLQRFPSTIYWSGLSSWGICRFRGSREEYYRSLDSLHWRQERLHLELDQVETRRLVSPNWDPELPDRPAELLGATGFALVKTEAWYLHDRIAASHPHSLLAHLIKPSGSVSAAHVWTHPAVRELPGGLREAVGHAQNFSETIQGAVLVYNLLLAQAVGSDASVETLTRKLGSWEEKISERWQELRSWREDLDSFWMSPAFEGTAIPRHTRAFLHHWLDLALRSIEAGRLVADRAAAQLVRDREFIVKRERAKLSYPRTPMAQQRGYGTRQLDFRWSVARGMISDICRGLE